MVQRKPLTITAQNRNKRYGAVQGSLVTVSSESSEASQFFTADGLVNNETVAVTMAYSNGALQATDTVGSSSSITPSVAVGGTLLPADYNYAINYVSGMLTVTQPPPTITLTGTLGAVSTTYGSASATPTSFHVSGSWLTGNLTVTPPSGYEVSLSIDSGYTSSLSIPASGNLGSTQVHVRLAATTAVNGVTGYGGNISVAGGGASSATIATVISTVSQATLTLRATNQNKKYGTQQTTPVAGSTAFSADNLKNGQTVGTVTLNYANGGLLATDAIGSTSTITPSNAAGGTFTPANYAIVYVAGTLTVTQVSYTEWAATNGVTGAAAADANQDGVPNGIAYFVNDTGRITLPSIVLDPDGKYTVTWDNGGNIPSSAYGSKFFVETSSDLVNWTEVGASDGNLRNTAARVSYTIPSGTGKTFVRLKVIAD